MFSLGAKTNGYTSALSRRAGAPGAFGFMDLLPIGRRILLLYGKILRKAYIPNGT